MAAFLYSTVVGTIIIGLDAKARDFLVNDDVIHGSQQSKQVIRIRLV